jgi:GrpB-like predicted nucleotidyltransferase (UPF0157 family)
MPIELVPHDPAWAILYEDAASGIRRALGSIALRIDHVGSTSIPGIVAKPVIDIRILVESYDPEAMYTDPLSSLGFAYDHRDEGHVLFKGMRERTKFNVHVVQKDEPDADSMVVFRDYLRSHPGEARRYEELKIGLAERHRDGDAYASAESSYVSEVIRLANASDGSRS